MTINIKPVNDMIELRDKLVEEKKLTAEQYNQITQFITEYRAMQLLLSDENKQYQQN